MSKDIELDDTLGEAQSLLTALFLAVGAISDQKDAIALQVVVTAAQDNLCHARCLIDDIREKQHLSGRSDILQLGDDLAALCVRFDRVKGKIGGQGA